MIPVKVPDNLPLTRNESLCDQPVDVPFGLIGTIAEANRWISCAHALSQDPAFNQLFATTELHVSADRADAAQVTHLVEAYKAPNRTPSFFLIIDSAVLAAGAIAHLLANDLHA